jgi:PleD family two-component response regulator
LIVDSDRLAILIAMMFKDEPTEVAFDGTTALDKIGDSPPDIIIEDVVDPGFGIDSLKS